MFLSNVKVSSEVSNDVKSRRPFQCNCFIFSRRFKMKNWGRSLSHWIHDTVETQRFRRAIRAAVINRIWCPRSRHHRTGSRPPDLIVLEYLPRFLRIYPDLEVCSQFCNEDSEDTKFYWLQLLESPVWTVSNFISLIKILQANVY